MPPYVALARKWRPAQFSDIVGQGPVVRTLMNAITSDRVHQAYLLTGSRGIGKTTIARILAKAVRCQKAVRVGDWLKSCDECSSCKEIAGGNSVDVIEIDGASNNGVDAVREIRENAKFLPATGSKKIYIIDEVHMLTTAAFNALLKTIEEPPAHVIFIFATTEPHKIPGTILSRCQRFDLRRHSPGQIQARLAEVTAAEKMEAQPAALGLLGRAAEGSMRDAMSLLDQVIAFSSGQTAAQGTVKITAEAVRESLGLIGSQTVLAIIRAVFERKADVAVQLVKDAYQKGHDLRSLTRGLIEFLHAALVLKVSGESSASLSDDLSPEEWAELKQILPLRSLSEIEIFFQVLHHGMDWIARSPQPKLVLDVLLIKCAAAPALQAVGQGSTSGSGSAQKSVSTPLAPSAPVATYQAAPAASPVAAPNGAPAPIAPAPVAKASAPVSATKTWDGFVQMIKETRPLLANILEHGVPETLPSDPTSDGVLTLCFRPEDSYFKEQLAARSYSEQMLAFGKTYFERVIRVKLELKNVGETVASRREKDREDREVAAKNAAKNHPIITEAKALFGGDLGPIELVREDDT
ncbi:MAG: DNA polymerase III subunit gamma/tau [Bdellovibrionales bacterium]|nr:DNA polymerase III subunit gamma/tau [Bdellovibrionales bacterium]